MTKRIGLSDIALDRVDYFLGERRELVVDQEYSVFADRDPDVAAFALEHVDRVGDLVGLDRDRVEVALLGMRAEGERHGQREQEFSHDSP